jgi:hypothetical protein
MLLTGRHTFSLIVVMYMNILCDVLEKLERRILEAELIHHSQVAAYRTLKNI